MIRYRLVCASGHEFDSWFANSAAYDKQAAASLVTCPDCGTAQVSKAIMAPAVSTGRKRDAARTARPQAVATQSASPAPETSGGGESPAELLAKMQVLARKMRDHVTSTFDNVGEKFAEEARRIHRGEAEERGIYGKADADEVRDLAEEGIDVLPLPPGPEDAN